MAAGYVALWGNDNNTGLDYTNAKRTIQGAKDASLAPIYVKGLHNEVLLDTNGITEGDPNFIWDGTNLVNTYDSASNIFRNIYFLNFNKLNGFYTGTSPTFQNCIIKNCNMDVSNASWNEIQDTLIYDCSELESIAFYGNNTVHSKGVGEILYINYTETGLCRNNIISNFVTGGIDLYDNGTLGNFTEMKYVLFINSLFKFRGTVSAESSFTAPAGADDDAKLQDLKNRMAAAYGGVASDYLEGSQYYSGSYNDIFINADIGDFTLYPNSIPANMSYDGSYIGAKGIGISTEFDTDFNSIVNISTTASTLGNVEDQDTDATTSSNIKDLGVVKNIYGIRNLGNLAYRNGQSFNTETDLGPELSTGATLIVDESYLVVNNTVTYNSVTYNPWETFLCVTGFTGFTGTGQVQQVDQDAFDEKVQIKVSKTDPTLSGVATLTVYTHKEIQINEDVNGIPTFGNADAGYVSGSAVDLDARYIQEIVTIKASSLPAR